MMHAEYLVEYLDVDSYEWLGHSVTHDSASAIACANSVYYDVLKEAVRVRRIWRDDEDRLRTELWYSLDFRD